MARTVSRVGIQTVARSLLLSNYGSFFQHYALRRVLRRMGLSPFRRERHGALNEICDWLWTIPLSYVRAWIVRVVSFGTLPRAGRSNICHARMRARFIRDYHRMIGRIGECRAHERAFAYIAGGDQVWYSRKARHFLLDTPDDAIKISYAASAPWDSMFARDRWCDLMRSVGKEFRGVSVRENAGRAVCQKLMPTQDVARTLDPVLLLRAEDYLSETSSEKHLVRPTLLAYFVNIEWPRTLPTALLDEAARATDSEVKIIGIQGTEDFIPREQSLAPSPADFLRCYRDARLVITNSFHGLAFSIVFHREFLFVPQGIDLADADGLASRNVRQVELLNRLGLSSRCVKSLAPGSIKEILRQPIDWSKVDELLSVERDSSLRWLSERLGLT